MSDRTRRRVLQGAGAGLVAGLAGCSSSSGSQTASSTSSGQTSSGTNYEPVTFLETPAETPGDTEKMWAPFKEYIRSQVDNLDFNVKFADNTSAIGQALVNDQAELTRSDMVLLANPDAFDVVGIVKEGGASVYFSGIATLPDSNIETLSDLEGKSIAFADRPSTSGSLYPNYMLHEAGLDSGKAPFGSPVDYDGVWTGSHQNAVKSLINRDDIVACGCDIAVLLDHISKDQWPDRVKNQSGRWDSKVGSGSPQLQLVKASTSLPFSPIIERSDWDHPLKSKIDEAIVSIDEGTLRDPKGDVKNPISAVSKASIDDYQPVIDVIDKLDVDLNKL